MAKSKEFERQYKEEGKRRIKQRQRKRLNKINVRIERAKYRVQNCCEGNPNCNGTTDCMWY